MQIHRLLCAATLIALAPAPATGFYPPYYPLTPKSYLRMSKDTESAIISREEAVKLATDWVDVWRDRDIDAIMDHFDQDKIEFHSPLIATLAGSDGVIQDCTSLRKYFLAGLDKYPKIHFQLKEVLTGKESMAMYYKSVNDMMSCEIMFINDKGKVEKVLNHYRASDEAITEGLGTEWICAWNSRNLEAFVEDRFDEAVELVSPFVFKITGQPILMGRSRLLDYFQGVLDKYPDLNFKLLDFLVGNESVAVYYKSVNDAKECVVMQMNEHGKVVSIWNHSCSSISSNSAINKNTIEFLPFRPEFADDFKRISEEWINEMFSMEESDNALLSDPEELIIKRGGAIWFARDVKLGVVGCAALMPRSEGTYELTKMGVRPAYRGAKIGEKLLVHVLEQARKMPIRRLFLLTNKKCEAAIRLYEKNGFVHDKSVMREFGEAYDSCDVAMKYAPIWQK